MSRLPTALVTNCSATRTVKPDLRGNDLPKNLTMDEALDLWCNELEMREATHTPGELYRGIGFYTIVKMCEFIYSDQVHIVSGGQGIMKMQQKIVPYDFTMDPKHRDSMFKIVTKEPFVPTAWWRMINQRRYNDPTPIATILDDKSIKLVVVACNSRFVKLIPDDILSCLPENLSKLRIISTKKSSGDIPQPLLPFVLRFDKRIKASSVGNRNDINHRAAHRFLSLISGSPKSMKVQLLKDDVFTHQDMIDESLLLIGPPPSNRNPQEAGVAEERLREFLDKDESLLSFSNADEAFIKLKQRYRSIGGILRFRKIWREAVQASTSGTSRALPKPKQPKAEKDAALKALESIKDRLTQGSVGGVASWSEEERSLKALRVFVDLLKENAPDARFSGAEVCVWAKEYYEAIDEQLPVHFTSANKLTHLLKSYYGSLGLSMTYSGGGSGGQTYTLN